MKAPRRVCLERDDVEWRPRPAPGISEGLMVVLKGVAWDIARVIDEPSVRISGSGSEKVSSSPRGSLPRRKVSAKVKGGGYMAW